MDHATSRCAECGWTINGPRCPTCGAAATATATVAGVQMEAAALLAVHEEDYPGLREVFAAFRLRDWLRYLTLSLQAAGVERPFTQSDGATHTWAFNQNSAVVLVVFDKTDHSVAIEAPVIEIRPESEPALLRTALSVAALVGPARVARRGAKLILTMTHRIDALPPPRLIAAIGEIAVAADHLDNILAFEFGGRLLGPQLRKGYVFDLAAAGTPRRLRPLDGAARPMPLRPSTSAPRRDGVVTAADVAGFLEVVREAAQLSKFFSDGYEREGAIHVAMAFRAALAGGLQLDAARQLLRYSAQVRDRTILPRTMRTIYQQILEQRGQAGPQPPPPWPVIPSHQAKTIIASRLDVAAAAENIAMRRALLLGAIAELILFCDLDPRLTERLRSIYAGSLGVDTASVEALHSTVARMTR